MSGHSKITGKLEKLRCKGLRADSYDEKPHPGKFVISKLAYGPSQLQQGPKIRVAVERIPIQITPDVENAPSDEERGDDQTTP